jgi:hypothetical protein
MIDEPWNKDNEKVLRVLGSRVSAKINVFFGCRLCQAI